LIVAVDDLDRLREQLPDLFADVALPSGWEEDWLFIPIENPESDVSALDQPQSFRLPGDDFGFLLNERGVVLPSFAGPSPFPGAPAMTSGGSVPPPDAFAFYLPFHYFHPTWWGVYVVFEGAYELARLLNLFSNSISTTVTTLVDNPVYFSRPCLTSSDFKKLPDASGWNSTPCSAK